MLPVIQAYLIAQGSHTGGHFYQSNNPDNPMRDLNTKLDIKKLAEKTENPELSRPYMEVKNTSLPYMSKENYLKDNDRMLRDIQGAGFAMQDNVMHRQTGETRENVAKVNAILKTIYLTVLPSVLSKISNGQDKGEIDRLTKSSGNKYVPHMIGATALSDLLQTKDSKNSLGFVVNNGQPGLVWNRRF